MRYVYLTILFIISFVLESTMFSYIPVAGVKPDLILIFVVFYALLRGPKEGAVVGLIGGLVQDLMLGSFIGLNTFSKMAVGYLTGLLEQKIYKENFFVPILTVALAVFVNETLVYLLGLSIESFPLDYIAVLKGIVFPLIIYDTCLTPFLYPKFYKSVQRGLLKRRDY